jgi:sulfur-oxidizing protein SoxX
MLKYGVQFTSLAPIVATLAATVFSVNTNSQELGAAPTEDEFVQQGKMIAFDRKKGNCLACHAMDDGNLPGNIGPPLVAMKARYPDKAKLRAQIYDARINNPHTLMIPFGPHGVITDEEIDMVTEYVYTL